jgi:ABC-type phosphate/phosphonate transport system substrate-binding protein
VDSKELVSERLHVVVKDPAIQSLADLNGKRLWTLLADYPTYLTKVVLDGKVDASTHFVLKQIGQALRGAKAVLRGDAEATILDDEQFARAREISGGQDLRSVFSSPVLTAIPVVLFGGGMSAVDREALLKVLKAMCQTSEGAGICKEMHIGRFVPLDESAFSAVRKRFGE